MKFPFENIVRDRMEAARSRQAMQKFRELYIADEPVDLIKIAEYRNDAFPPSGPSCWLDRPNALLEIERKKREHLITEAQAEICSQWVIDGYYIAPGLISLEKIERAWRAYEAAIAEGTITVPCESLGPDDVFPGRKLDPHLHVPAVKELLHEEKIIEITDLLFGRRTLPFQTIIGHKGSSQDPHSDAIHMTTYPLGYLIACWIALEDIHPDSGPLEFYPQSHRLVPMLLSGDLGIAPLDYKKGLPVYAERYEPAIRNYIDRGRLKPELFLAKAGDVLFWHANLLHGGARRNNLKLTRKALVCHYFAEGVVTYHDLSGNPSRLHRNGLYAPPVVD